MDMTSEMRRIDKGGVASDAEAASSIYSKVFKIGICFFKSDYVKVTILCQCSPP